MVNKALFLYNFTRKKVLHLGSYDNDWLFLDDDLFCVWVDDPITDCREIERLQRECAMQRLEDEN